MAKLWIMLLGIATMFAASFLFVGICWHIDDKARDREIKRKYPNWRK